MQTKMKAQISQGPWQVGFVDTMIHTKSILPERYARIYMPDNDCAFVTGSHDTENARAIAAVPDLIAACEDELTALKNWLSANHTYKSQVAADMQEGMCISVAKITAALQKAGVL